jgi:hypothetical protein
LRSDFLSLRMVEDAVDARVCVLHIEDRVFRGRGLCCLEVEGKVTVFG